MGKGGVEFGGRAGAVPTAPQVKNIHGTIVAGIAVETGENLLMAAGVAYSAGIVPINITWLDALFTLEEDLVEGINYAASLNNVRVINISFSGYNANAAVEQAVNDAFSQGKILVACAGNEDTYRKKFPAGFKNVISVAAADVSGNKSNYSNYDDSVDVSALSDGVSSTSYKNKFVRNQYGTSFGAPQVAGSIALLISRYPNLSRDDIIDITLQRPETFYYEHGLPDLGCGVVNPGNMLTSKAPLIDSSILLA